MPKGNCKFGTQKKSFWKEGFNKKGLRRPVPDKEPLFRLPGKPKKLKTSHLNWRPPPGEKKKREDCYS